MHTPANFITGTAVQDSSTQEGVTTKHATTDVVAILKKKPKVHTGKTCPVRHQDLVELGDKISKACADSHKQAA